MKKIAKYFLISIVAIGINSNTCQGQASSSDPFRPAPAPNQPFSASDFLGWDASVTIPLDIKHYGPFPINFYTNFSSFTTPRMTIEGTTGNVGIGTPPLFGAFNYKLTVDNDINLATSAWLHGYWINKKLIMSIPGTQNTLVGEGAGNPAVTNTYVNNTMFGYFAGGNLTSGHSNTFMGSNAGHDNETSIYNTFVGTDAGYSHVSGEANTFVGRNAGRNDHTGKFNTFVGEESGQSNYLGENNSFFGHHSGNFCTGSDNTLIGNHAAYLSTADQENVIIGSFAANLMDGGNRNTIVGTHAGQVYESGDENVIVGFKAGFYNSDGDSNVFVGVDAGHYNYFGKLNLYLGAVAGPPISSNQLLRNASAIGALSQVLHNNEMILGNNTINVGIGLSGNATGPRAKLEINDGSVGVSGLQFRTLTSSFAPGLTASKFLTVDNDGKVILRDIPGGGGSVSACSTATINYLPKWSLISPTKELCNSLIFDDGTKVGVDNITPLQKLDVNGNVNLTKNDQSYYIANDRFLGSGGNGNQSSIELGHGAGPSPGANNGFSNILIGRSTGSSLTHDESFNVLIGENAGSLMNGSYSSSEASRNVLIGTTAGSNITSGATNTFVGHWAGGKYSGIDKYSSNTFLGAFSGYYATDKGDDNILLGNDTHLSGDGTPITKSGAIGSHSWVGSNDAIVLGVSDATVLMGYNTIPSGVVGNCKLYVTGNSDDVAYFNGNVYASGAFTPSDRHLKTNIQDLSPNEAADILGRLNPSSYEYDRVNHPGLSLPLGHQYGLIADELELILPELVKQFTSPDLYDSARNLIGTSETFKAINYSGIIPILIKAIQTEKQKNDSLEVVVTLLSRHLDALEQAVQNCCNSGSSSRKSGKSVELTNSIILNQNSPNPFAEETIIKFIIPSTVIEAKIIFFENNGAVLKTVSIDERGEGQITVFAENLSAGIYSYSLIVDNKLIDTKKMLCTKK